MSNHRPASFDQVEFSRLLVGELGDRSEVKAIADMLGESIRELECRVEQHRVRRMSTSSIFVLVLGALVAAGLCLYPPWSATFAIPGRSGPRTVTPFRYAAIWSPPPRKEENAAYGVEIDVVRLTAGVAVATLGTIAAAASIHATSRLKRPSS